MQGLIRLAARFAFGLQRAWWSIDFPVTLGVAALVLDSSQRILLVRSTYRNAWALPGGGVKRGESVCAAMTRELLEETGVQAMVAPDNLRSVFYNKADFKHDHVVLFVINDWEQVAEVSSVLEVEDTKFFAIDHLPVDILPSAKRQILSYIDGSELSETW